MCGILAIDLGHVGRHAPWYGKRSCPTIQIDEQSEQKGMSDYRNY